jgi:predicted HTH transcriptional regulator
MSLDIKEWNSEEAQIIFERIEDKSNREWFDIDWKETLNYSDTTNTNNTIQKTICGFANTYGGSVVIGFEDKDRTPKGVEKKANIENEISDKLKNKIRPTLPLIKTKYYSYKEKDILVIFIAKSKKPLFTDQGIAYYRNQSQFISMPYDILERKFRDNFEEEKYLELVKNDLRRISRWAKDGMRRVNIEGRRFSSYDAGQSLNVMTKTILESGDKLYNYYKENNLLSIYNNLIDLLVVWLAAQGESQRGIMGFNGLEENVNGFLKSLK